MLDCYGIRQGMIFFVEDITSESSVMFKGEKLPKKRRPWIVVSNNRNNAYAPHVTMVPVFTGNEIHLPTQVCFMCNGKERIARCEMINCIPKELVDIRGYVGTLAEPVYKKIEECLKIHFGMETPKTEKVENSIAEVLKSTNVENIVASKVCEILFKGLNISETNNYTVQIPVEPAQVEPSAEDVAVETVVSAESISQVTTTSEDVIVKTPKTRGKRGPYKPRGNTMNLDQCMEFYQDTISMTPEEVYEKWKTFGVENTRTSVTKKKYAIKHRLIKEGLLIGE